MNTTLPYRPRYKDFSTHEERRKHLLSHPANRFLDAKVTSELQDFTGLSEVEKQSIIVKGFKAIDTPNNHTWELRKKLDPIHLPIVDQVSTPEN